MFDPVLVSILLTTFAYGACGSLAAMAVRFLGRKQPGPRLDQVGAVGFLIGVAFGAMFAILKSPSQKKSPST